MGALGTLQYGSSLELKLVRIFPDESGCSEPPKNQQTTETHNNYGETVTIVDFGGCLLSQKSENAALMDVNILLVYSDIQKVVPFGKLIALKATTIHSEFLSVHVNLHYDLKQSQFI